MRVGWVLILKSDLFYLEYMNLNLFYSIWKMKRLTYIYPTEIIYKSYIRCLAWWLGLEDVKLKREKRFEWSEVDSQFLNKRGGKFLAVKIRQCSKSIEYQYPRIIITCGKCFKTFYRCKLWLFIISQCLFLAIFSSLVKYLRVRQEPTQVKQLACVPLWNMLLALSTRFRLGWKSLLGTNTLAYNEKS